MPDRRRSDQGHGRIGALDGLRGVAAMSVVLYHYTRIYREEFGHSFPSWIDVDHGFYGVNLFFMISGFVIYMTASSCKTWGEFLVKRVSRLYPTYWACLAITFTVITVYFLSPKRSITPGEAAVNLTMLQTLFGVKHVDGAYWSLYPELTFYVIIAVVMAFGALRHLQWIGLGWLALEWTGYFQGPDVPIDLGWGGFFLAGITAYRIVVMGERTLFNHAYLLLTLVVNMHAQPGFKLYPVVYAVFLLPLFFRVPLFAHPALRYLGTISYALYLIHQNVGYAIIRNLKHMGVPDLPAVLLAIGCAIGIAHLVTFFIEKPMIPRMRSALFRVKDGLECRVGMKRVTIAPN